MREVVRCTMWLVWWNSVLREVLCDMKCVIRWGMMVRHGMRCSLISEMAFDVEWCDVICGNDTMRCEMQCQCYTFHISPPQLNNISHWTTFLAQHTIPHLISFHIFNTTRSHLTWRDVDSVVWNLVRCGMFCNARCGMLCLIHPNVAVIWNKVRCRICVIWCNATCAVMQCHGRSCEMWWCDVD